MFVYLSRRFALIVPLTASQRLPFFPTAIALGKKIAAWCFLFYSLCEVIEEKEEDQVLREVFQRQKICFEFVAGRQGLYDSFRWRGLDVISGSIPARIMDCRNGIWLGDIWTTTNAKINYVPTQI